MCNKVCIICNKEKDCLDYNLNGRDGYRNLRCKYCLSVLAKEKRKNYNEFKSKTTPPLKKIDETVRVCKACNVEYPINYFWSVNKDKGTRNARCKICYKKKIYIYKDYDGPKYKVIPRHKQTYNQILRLNHVKKEDYVKTYKFLTAMKYDITKNISRQFCEKYNLKYKEKNREAEPQYLFDGTLNPRY